MQKSNSNKVKNAGKNDVPVKQIAPKVKEELPNFDNAESIKADAAIIAGNRELQQEINESRVIHEQIGEMIVISKGLEDRGVVLRQNILTRQQALRNAMNELYGEGSMLAEDGETIVLPNKEENVESTD